MSEPTTLDRLQHWTSSAFDRIGLEYTAELIRNAATELEAAQTTIANQKAEIDRHKEVSHPCAVAISKSRYKKLLEAESRMENQQDALDAVRNCQRYAVNQKIGLKGEYPLYADKTGSWYGVGDVEKALAKAEVKP